MENDNKIMVINDLIKINNDRIEGYRKAAENFQDNDIRLLSVFNDCAMESRENNQELINQINRLGGSPGDGTTLSGKIYRAWMDVKASFGGDDAKGILESCETGEDAAKKAYETAVNSGYLDTQTLSVVVNQQQKQLQSHDRIKMLRDEYKD